MIRKVLFRPHRREELSLILRNQQQFFASGHTKNLSFRKSTLLRFEREFRASEQKLLTALEKDLHKNVVEGYASEIVQVRNELRYVWDHIDSWTKPRKSRPTLINFPGDAWFEPTPYGVALIVGAWNYPLFLTLVPLIGAIAAGNCAIIKPSEKAPETAQELKRLIDASFDPQHVSCVNGGAEISQQLIELGPEFVFFTGSTESGRSVMRASSSSLAPSVLELGSKNPCIVDESAHIRIAARRIVWSKFFCVGQTCVAPDFVAIHANRKYDFLRELICTIYEFYGQNPQRCPDYGRIVSEYHFERLVKLLDGANHPVVGGNGDKSNLFLPPTVVVTNGWNDPLMKEEIFGPILPVVVFEHLDEVLEKLSASHPLCLYAFCDNKASRQKIIEGIRSGAVGINGTMESIVSPRLPFGGIGVSGMGRYRGKHSFDAFSTLRSFGQRSSTFGLPFQFPPYRFPLWLTKWALRHVL